MIPNVSTETLQAALFGHIVSCDSCEISFEDGIGTSCPLGRYLALVFERRVAKDDGYSQ